MRDRRNLTPDQLALVMGRHYNRTKKSNGGKREAHPQKEDMPETTSDRLAKQYGVSDNTILRAGKLAAAVDTLRAVDPRP